MIDILKNPVVIGILAGTLTYSYLWWHNETKYKKDIKERKTTGILMPAIVGLVVWALYHVYLDLTGELILEDGVNASNYNITKDVPSINEAVDFRMIEKGLTLPNNLVLPDVFIENMN